MYRQLFVSCLLLALSVELLEAKNDFYKRSANHQKLVQRLMPQTHQKRQTVIESCEHNQFLCGNRNRCISKNYVCDSDNDCGDHSDEPANCLTRDCDEGEVKCPNGRCLDATAYCTGSASCGVRLAAVTPIDCPPAQCEEGYFACPRLTRCIQNSWICDGDNDCYDLSDEQNCHEKTCNDDEIRCNSGQCIAKLSYCLGGWASCRDGTNITGSCLDYSCPDEYFKCPTDGICISNSNRCDGVDSCSDGADEHESICPPVQCPEGYTRCPRRNRCINSRYFCDTDNDCGDNSDEAPELCRDRQCGDDEIKCNNGQCLSKEGYCREQFVCRDGSQHMSECPPVTCHEGYTRCENRNKCINDRYFCDTDNDCGDNSDEAPELCNNRQCAENEITCDNGQCIPTEGFCSDAYGCRDNSRLSNDTKLCKPIECDSGLTKCPFRQRCIRSRYVCDTDNDCGDGSDEAPEVCEGRQCLDNEATCSNGQCIPYEDFCRGNANCRSGSPTQENVPACAGFSQTVEEPVIISSYSNQYQCMMGVRTTCGQPSISEQFDGLTERDAFAKLAEIELSEICTSITEWKDCAHPYYESNEHCQQAEQQIPWMQEHRKFSLKVLNFVCVEHIEVINRNKGCLFQTNEDGHPVLAFKVMMSCASHLSSMGGPGPRGEPFCLPHELQECVKGVVSEECGDDIATVGNQLWDMARETCKEPEAVTHDITPQMKRQAREMAMLKRMLRTVF